MDATDSELSMTQDNIPEFNINQSDENIVVEDVI